MQAIHGAETNGTFRCDTQGKSGELKSCLQFLPETFDAWSRETIGYVAPVTKINEMYIATLMVQKWLERGYSERDIFLTWNAGRPVEVRGINKHGVQYDSGQYASKALAYLR